MKRPAHASHEPYRVQVLDRAFAILDLLAEDGGELGGAELAARLDLHKSTAHRLLAVLERNCYVEKSPGNGKYRLGWKLIDLGMRAVSRMDVRELARPELERLSEETGETAHLGVLQKGEVVSVANVQSRRSLRTPATVGQRSPAHCTSQGKVMLAHLSQQDLRDFVRTYGLKAYTGNTLTRFAALRAELERVRRQGYAVDNEEFEEGLKCVGAPVRDHSGTVVGAISIAGPASRLGRDRVPALVHSVTSAASRLSVSLGYRERERAL